MLPASLYYYLPPEGVALLRDVLRRLPDSARLASLYTAAERAALSNEELETLAPLLVTASASEHAGREIPSSLAAFLRAARARPKIGSVPGQDAAAHRGDVKTSRARATNGEKTLGQMTEEERELWREERRARAAHREYGFMVADVRRREITQVSAMSMLCAVGDCLGQSLLAPGRHGHQAQSRIGVHRCCNAAVAAPAGEGRVIRAVQAAAVHRAECSGHVADGCHCRLCAGPALHRREQQGGRKSRAESCGAAGSAMMPALGASNIPSTSSALLLLTRLLFCFSICFSAPAPAPASASAPASAALHRGGCLRCHHAPGGSRAGGQPAVSRRRCRLDFRSAQRGSSATSATSSCSGRSGSCPQIAAAFSFARLSTLKVNWKLHDR